jgi:metal-responsive CopG/Arc/MetJ family transcriptional regulator
MPNTIAITSLPQHGVQLRLDAKLFQLVENWRRSQPEIPSRSEAIRKLVRKAMETEQRRAAS